MAATVLLVGLLLTATVTDVRARKVYNWTTYPGILLALLANGRARLGGWISSRRSTAVWGWWVFRKVLPVVRCAGSSCCCATCFFLGGGRRRRQAAGHDRRFPRPVAGTGGFALDVRAGRVRGSRLIVWRVGALRLLRLGFQRVSCLLRFRVWTALTDEERAPWKTDVFLSPAALAAVLFVQLSWI
jgi:prepilin peptidase CpaA